MLNILLLGEQDSIHLNIANTLGKHYSVTHLGYGEVGGSLIDSDWDGVTCIVLSLLKRWDLLPILAEARRRNIPVIGLHTSTENRMRDRYLTLGMKAYISIFDFIDEHEQICEQITNEYAS